MKQQVVKTNKGYVAISDEKITEGFFLHPKGVIFPVTEIYIRGPISTGLMKKIIATDSTFKLEGIPQFELEKDELEKMALEYASLPYKNWPKDAQVILLEDNARLDFIAGYKAAQSKGCFTEEDIIKAIRFGKDLWKDAENQVKNGVKKQLFVKDFIDSLKQPKKLVAIEINDMEASQWISNEKEHGRVNINLPIVTKSEQHPDGLLTIKQYFYE